jgi:L-2,4-diaminobutyrate decarboxylase
MERIITNDLSKKLGFPKETYGFITAGATLATFTALLTARSVKASQNVWKEGSYKLGVMVSEQAHYSVDRAAKIMGLGESGVIKIPTNTDYQMDTSKLNEIFEKTKAAGIEVFAIVGSACSTATGSFDNLLEIASFAEQNNLWFHVDGAHGGGLAFSEKFKSLVAGISKADSVAMDFHKMLLVPSLATALLYKNYKDSYKTFSQNASYLYEEIDEDWQNMGKRTFECTKPASVFRAYTALKTKGLDTMIKTTEYLYDLGIAFGKILEENPLFEIPVKPAGNIVCFRIKDENANELNQKIRQKLLEEGKYFVVSTKLENQFYLRVSIMNPLTTINTLTELLEDIKTIADRLRTN